MTQNQNIKLIKKVFINHFKNDKIRFIKIHGGRFQESGLPDMMILVKSRQLKFWLEVKRDWNDTPSKIQQYNIADLRLAGFITGYVAGPEITEIWENSKKTKISEYLLYFFSDPETL